MLVKYLPIILLLSDDDLFTESSAAIVIDVIQDILYIELGINLTSIFTIGINNTLEFDGNLNLNTNQDLLQNTVYENSFAINKKGEYEVER